jgi:hypothetical protein
VFSITTRATSIGRLKVPVHLILYVLADGCEASVDLVSRVILIIRKFHTFAVIHCELQLPCRKYTVEIVVHLLINLWV